jgi:PIN domain nuclease of toxin-antitoxin system
VAAGLLLDTHIFLWWRIDAPELTEACRGVIAEADIVFVSAASAWEVAIKIALGKLEIPEPFETGVEASQFEKLRIGFRHAEEAGRLPPHHRDPFDRMLISQSRVEGLTLVTQDRRLEPYDASILWNRIE